MYLPKISPNFFYSLVETVYITNTKVWILISLNQKIKYLMQFGLQRSDSKIQQDCPYNNSKVNRVKANGFNKEQLRCSIYTASKPQMNQYQQKQQIIIPLQTAFADDELVLPVRNIYCNQKTQCLWDFEELCSYLSTSLFQDLQNKANQCYYCVGCQKELYRSNSRLLRDLYLDKELLMYLSLARKQYENDKQPKKERFKKGFIKIHKVGLVQYQYKVNTQSGKISKTKILRDIRQRPEDQQMKFDYNDCIIGSRNLQTALCILGRSLTRKLKIQREWKIATGSIDVKNIPDFYQGLAQVARSQVIQSVRFNDNTQRRSNQFTFVFKTQCHHNPIAPQLTFLVVYYPHLRLWRKYAVKGVNKPFPIIDSGLYIKDPRFPCIYVVGGGRIKYVEEKEGLIPVTKRKIDYNRETYGISLQGVNPLLQTRLAPMKKKISLKGDKLGSSMHISEATEAIVGEMHPNTLVAKPLGQLPEKMCLSAGTFHNNYIFVFGGLTNGDGKDAPLVPLKSAYKLNLNSPGSKWQKLRPAPFARWSHSALVYNNLIYLIGGKDSPSFCSKKVDIYNPASDTYQSKQLVQNPYLQQNNNVFADRCIACKLNNEEFLMVNGYFYRSYIFNAKTLQFYPGGPQIYLPVLVRNWKGVLSDEGPRIQQVFDSQPPKLNDIFFYAHNSLVEQQIRVVYGNKDNWYLSQEEDQDHEKSTH